MIIKSIILLLSNLTLSLFIRKVSSNDRNIKISFRIKVPHTSFIYFLDYNWDYKMQFCSINLQNLVRLEVPLGMIPPPQHYENLTTNSWGFEHQNPISNSTYTLQTLSTYSMFFGMQARGGAGLQNSFIN